MERCQHCNEPIFQFDDGPEWAEGWALDKSGDPVEDFICHARETSARFPEGKPHEPVDSEYPQALVWADDVIESLRLILDAEGLPEAQNNRIWQSLFDALDNNS